MAALLQRLFSRGGSAQPAPLTTIAIGGQRAQELSQLLNRIKTSMAEYPDALADAEAMDTGPEQLIAGLQLWRRVQVDRARAFQRTRLAESDLRPRMRTWVQQQCDLQPPALHVADQPLATWMRMGDAFDPGLLQPPMSLQWQHQIFELEVAGRRYVSRQMFDFPADAAAAADTPAQIAGFQQVSRPASIMPFLWLVGVAASRRNACSTLHVDPCRCSCDLHQGRLAPPTYTVDAAFALPSLQSR